MVDRFAQIEPTVLLVVDGYRYGNKVVDRTSEVAQIRAGLPSLTATIVVPYLQPDPGLVPGAVAWDELLADPGPLAFEEVRFDHPLYILFSSGTTGLPKAIVHCHGGILLEHLKTLALHHDLGPSDRFCWYTTTGWMMWNYLVSGLAVGSTIVLVDGDPGHPDLGSLWRLVGETGTTYFGSSAPFLLACRKAGIEPAKEADLSALRGIGSTGAPLPAEGFRWVHEHVSTAPLHSVSGGTDVCSAFVGGSPLVPVWEGELSCRSLGAAVAAFDEQGHSVVGQQGELVITAPMPSMPVGFWGDDDGSRYREAYFAEFPGVWRHGDWITITERGSCTITGRSDATLNRGGVRLGTAELYSIVEARPEIVDSLVRAPRGLRRVGQASCCCSSCSPRAPRLTTALRGDLARSLRTELSPRHVPDAVHAVPAIPRTLSGKRLEVPIKRILTGTPLADAVSVGSLADPEALDAFVALARARHT